MNAASPVLTTWLCTRSATCWCENPPSSNLLVSTLDCTALTWGGDFWRGGLTEWTLTKSGGNCSSGCNFIPFHLVNLKTRWCQHARSSVFPICYQLILTLQMKYGLLHQNSEQLWKVQTLFFLLLLKKKVAASQLAWEQRLLVAARPICFRLFMPHVHSFLLPFFCNSSSHFCLDSNKQVKEIQTITHIF